MYISKLHRTVCLILGGGRGTRLYPLTKSRSKPAVPIAGKYRLIDIPISNCIHSDLNRIFVLTQFNSVSLHNHIANAYKFDVFGGGFVEILAAQQTMENESWYQGTADAVRRNLTHFDRSDVDLVLILSGDQLYRMDFAEMISNHLENQAEVSIAALPVDEKSATACGIMRIDVTGKVIDFVEKPKTREALAQVYTDPHWLGNLGLKAHGKPYLASMGIYLFDRKLLVDLLAESSASTDFGKELFPQLIAAKRKVQTYLFEDYWEDIGTVGAFHQANIDLTKPDPPFRFTSGGQSIFTRPRFLPCSKLSGAVVKDSLISDGCLIGEGSRIENSVIGVRACIGANVVIRNSYVMGADSYEIMEDGRSSPAAGVPRIGIGDGCHIENAIIDKNARIGANVRIVNEKSIVDSDDEESHGMIRDGIVVVPKFTIIPAGSKI